MEPEQEAKDGNEKCVHYDRKCLIKAVCCNKTYACRYCHDLKEFDDPYDIDQRHKIDIAKIDVIVCIDCQTEQKIQSKCVSCGVNFGNYFCEICRLFDNNDKKQFHCDKCQICRIGGRENYFHCDKCGCCLPNSLLDKHKCFEKTLNNDCPVCLVNMNDSQIPCSVLKCGHSMHYNCLMEFGKRDYRCPLCSKAICDTEVLFQAIEIEVNLTMMPIELQKDTNILCNDCEKDSTVKFHIVAMKCVHCGSYNTKIK